MVLIGTTLAARYRVVAHLASGGMADVYRAEDTRTGDAVAVKALRVADDADAERFLAEARVLARLRHPNVVRLLSCGQHDEQPFLVLELVDGDPLRDLLRDGPFRPERVRRLCADIAAGLAYVHERSVIHRDVTPANVLVDTAGRARLGDFGIACSFDTPTVDVSGFVTGTAAYIAPEQLAYERISPAVDVYALGLILLECLTGRRAFAGTPAEVVLARLARDPYVPDDLPVRWRDLVRAMTARDPAARPGAAAVHAALTVPDREPAAVGHPAG